MKNRQEENEYKFDYGQEIKTLVYILISIIISGLIALIVAILANHP